MAPPHSDEDWRRVGQMLRQRRVHLDQRYRVRRIFAKERGITDKTAQEIEYAPKYRTSFSPEMLASIEAAYAIAPGSMYKALNDPDLTEFPDRVGEASIHLTTADGRPALASVPAVKLGAAGDPDPGDVIPGDPISAEKGEVQIWALTNLPWEIRRDLIVHLRWLDQQYKTGQQEPEARRENGTEG